mmetsp:Transcript_20164/g.31489  ORF Transcript_20164/g.31489 Transcript_20164/m.31489 type:complete len:137 (+) Transcript_20164:206-616(+)
MKSRNIEPLRSKVKEELSASGVFTAAGANAILQKVVMESESTGALSKSDLTASINSINTLGLGDNEEQVTPTIEQSVMGKLSAPFSSFFMSSIEGLRDELDSPNLSEVRCQSKERNIAPRAIRTDIKSHKCSEVKW